MQSIYNNLYYIYPGTVEKIKSNISLNIQKLRKFEKIQTVRNFIYIDLAFIIASLAVIIFTASFELSVALSLGAFVGVGAFCVSWDKLTHLTRDLYFREK